MMGRCSSRMTNEGPGYSHDMEVMTRMMVSMMTDVRMKFVGHVLGSYELIMWVVMYRDHVIGRSRDHDIILYLKYFYI